MRWREGLLRTSDEIRGQPKPISPYSRDPYLMLSKIRDRVSGKPVEQKWLRTYANALRGYHRHPETKFLHGESIDSGATHRRHVFVEAVEDIGKEADKWDEEEPLSADDEFTVSYGVSGADRQQMLTVIQSVSKRQLARAAHVSFGPSLRLWLLRMTCRIRSCGASLPRRLCWRRNDAKLLRQMRC